MDALCAVDCVASLFLVRVDVMRCVSMTPPPSRSLSLVCCQTAAPASPRTPLHIAGPSLTARRALATSILQQQVWGVTESCSPGPGAYSLSWNQVEVRGAVRCGAVSCGEAGLGMWRCGTWLIAACTRLCGLCVPLTLSLALLPSLFCVVVIVRAPSARSLPTPPVTF